MEPPTFAFRAMEILQPSIKATMNGPVVRLNLPLSLVTIPSQPV